MTRIVTYFFMLLLAVGCTDSGTQSEAANEASEPVDVHSWAKSANMYEVNIRQYTEEGTFNAFAGHLPRLKEMGVDIVWLMPIHPIGEKNRKGGMGSYYSVRDYKDVAPEYGTKEDFQNLVDQVHELDMKIIIDWVANHSAWDNVWVDAGHTDWYTPDSNGNMQPPLGTDWWDVADLDYENQEMRAAMIDALQFWVRDYNIDGYRCDVAEWVPVDFWEEARVALDSVGPVFMLAEAEFPDHHNSAFHMSYGWDLHHRMNQIAKGEKDPAHIRDYLEVNAKRFPEDAYRLHFTSNHDENSWNGTVKERMGDGVETFAVLAATLEGMPLIYSGQEAGLDHRLAFFEKDEIKWDQLPLEDFYSKLLHLKKENESLWNGAFGGDAVIIAEDEQSVAYYRKKGDDAVVVVLNLSAEAATVTLGEGEYDGVFKDLFAADTAVKLANGVNVELDPWGYKVYHTSTK